MNRQNRQNRHRTREGRARVRAAARLHRPWEHSAGPRTQEGKASSSRNSALGREGPSIRQMKAELAEVFALLDGMAAARRLLSRRGLDDPRESDHR